MNRDKAGKQLKDRGNVADIMVTGIFILAMAVVMLSFLENIKMIQQKSDVDQIARRYILRMESTGGLTGEDRILLMEELDRMGITQISLEGTTPAEAGYGTAIVLQIHGFLEGRYEFYETRVSTAKH